MENFSKKKILTASIWNFVGIVLIRAVNYLAIPIFTRLLTTSEFGIVSGYVSYISLLGIVIGFGLNTSISVARINYNGNFATFNSSILYASFYWFIFLLLIVNATFELYYPIIKIDRIWVNFIFLASFAGYVIDSFYKINTIDYKFKYNTLLGAVNSMSGLLLSVFLVRVFSDRVAGRLIGQYLLCFIVAIILFFYIGKKKPFKVERKALKFAVPVGIPNMVHLASQIVMGQSDRVFILQLCDSSKVAVYSVGYTVASLLQVVWAAVNEVWTPWLFRALKNGNNSTIIHYSKIYLKCFSFVFAVFILVCPELTVFMSTSDYAEVKSFVAVIVLSSYCVFVYSFFVNIELYHRKNRYMAVATIIAAVTNIIGNSILIPKYGYIAAAYTTLVSYFVLVIMHFIILDKVIKKNIYKRGTFLPSMIIEMIITGISVFFCDNIIIRWVMALIIIVLFIVVVFLKRKEIKSFVNEMRHE